MDLTLVDVDEIGYKFLERNGMGSYVEALQYAKQYGGAQVHAMVWQAIFRHMLIERRRMCQKAEADFFEVQRKAERKIRAMGLTDAPYLEWMMIFMLTRKLTGQDAGIYDQAKSMIETWQSQTKDSKSS